MQRNDDEDDFPLPCKWHSRFTWGLSLSSWVAPFTSILCRIRNVTFPLYLSVAVFTLLPVIGVEDASRGWKSALLQQERPGPLPWIVYFACCSDEPVLYLEKAVSGCNCRTDAGDTTCPESLPLLRLLGGSTYLCNIWKCEHALVADCWQGLHHF